jgi:hypothetical protein
MNSSHYDPEQPRVAKGHEGGGRWTRDGDRAFKVAFLEPGLPVPSIDLGLLLDLFRARSTRNGPNSQAVIEFKASDYQPTSEKVLDTGTVVQLNRREVEAACKRLEKVEEFTDKGVEEANKNLIRGPREFGTAVHSYVNQQIKNMKDPNFRSEVSYLKMKEEKVYGTPGSIRVDVLEQRSDRTVCVYDIKTGKSGLSTARLGEIAKNVYGAYPETNRIIITEVRPAEPRWFDQIYK